MVMVRNVYNSFNSFLLVEILLKFIPFSPLRVVQIRDRILKGLCDQKEIRLFKIVTLSSRELGLTTILFSVNAFCTLSMDSKS